MLSLKSDRRHLSGLRILYLAFVALNRCCGTPLLVPRVWLFMLGKDFAPYGRACCSVLAMNPVCFVFAVGQFFYVDVITITQGTMIHLMCLLDSMARVQSVDAVFVFVGDTNAHHSECLESVSPTDRHGRDALNLCNLSGCEQLVRCPTHVAGNRLDLVMTNASDIVDLFVGTPLELLITVLSVVLWRTQLRQMRGH